MASSAPQPVLLSPLDQLAEQTSMTKFVVFETPDPCRALASLKVGLQRLHRQLPYLGGQVCAMDGGRVGVRWSPADKELEVRKMPTEGAVLAGMSYHQLKSEGAPIHYFPASLSPQPFFVPIRGPSGVPVFAANYMCLDGALVVGVCSQHNVQDGVGAAELLRLWAHCTRSKSDAMDEAFTPDPEELLHRHRLLRTPAAHNVSSQSDTTPSSWQDLLARHPQLTLRAQQTTTAGPDNAMRSRYLARGSAKLFTFSMAKLDALKAALRAQASSEPGATTTRTWLTTNNVLGAVVWSSITRARAVRRGADFATRSQLQFPVNARRHLGLLQLQPPFLGNVLYYTLAGAAVPELMRAGITTGTGTGSGPGPGPDLSGLAAVAKAIAGATARVTPESTGELMDLVERVPDREDLVSRLNSFGGADMKMTNWTHMGLYEIDFGEGIGRPQFVRVPDAKVDGTMVVLPRRMADRDEGTVEVIELVVYLHAEDMAVLETDEAFSRCLVSA